MKCLITKLNAFLFLAIPTIACAGWQVAKPDTKTSATSADPFFQANYKKETAQPRPISTAPIPVAVSGPVRPVPIAAPMGPRIAAAINKPAEVYAISVSGSLKENIERIMDRYHWKVVWKAPYDYNFDGRVTGSSLPSVMEQLLKPFPLQAVLYMSNRTMTIVPRNA